MRSIGIIRDGESDFYVVRKLLKVIFEKERQETLNDDNFLNFDSQDFSFYNELNDFIRKRSKNCIFEDNEFQKFSNKIITKIFTAFTRMSREFEGTTNKDILVLYSDSEKLLVKDENYFTDWAYSIRQIFDYSIDKFYHKISKEGYSYNNIPLIIPMILFPSSEIIVASCMYDFDRANIRELKPTPALKEKVYGFSNIPEAFDNNAIEETINTYLVSDNLNDIYRLTPELRKVIHILSS